MPLLLLVLFLFLSALLIAIAMHIAVVAAVAASGAGAVAAAAVAATAAAAATADVTCLHTRVHAYKSDMPPEGCITRLVAHGLHEMSMSPGTHGIHRPHRMRLHSGSG